VRESDKKKFKGKVIVEFEDENTTETFVGIAAPPIQLVGKAGKNVTYDSVYQPQALLAAVVQMEKRVIDMLKEQATVAEEKPSLLAELENRGYKTENVEE
jgi:hypothetical protein